MFKSAVKSVLLNHFCTVSNSTFQVYTISTTNNTLLDTSTTSLDSSGAILNLSSDIDEILIKNLLESDQNYTAEDTGWINLIKAFPLERNVKQGNDCKSSPENKKKIRTAEKSHGCSSSRIESKVGCIFPMVI